MTTATATWKVWREEVQLGLLDLPLETVRRLQLVELQVRNQADLEEWIVMLSQATGEDPNKVKLFASVPGTDVSVLQALVSLWENLYEVNLPTVPVSTEPIALARFVA